MHIPHSTNRVLFVFCIALMASVGNAEDTLPTVPAFTPKGANTPIESPFKNLARLNHLNSVQLQRAMGFISESLGVTCDYCHDENNYAADQRSQKKRGLEMIAMVQHLNKRYFKKERISCFTCHRGSPVPVNLPETEDSPAHVENNNLSGGLASVKRDKKSVITHTLNINDEINENFFNKEVITCFTCHRGDSIPKQYPNDWR